MALFGESLKRLAQRMQSCEDWIEMVRDLRKPIEPAVPPAGLTLRWAEKDDLFAICALEGFIRETEAMEASLRKGDRCLLVAEGDKILAFAWVTFRDFKMALWYTLKLPAGWSYLEYIFVHPAVSRRGIGGILLGALLAALRERGSSHLVAGMYADWEASIRLHTKAGFRVKRRLTQCRILGILPTPPQEHAEG